MAPDDPRPLHPPRALRPVTTERAHVSGGQGLLARYEALAQISHAMLEAARSGDWLRIEALESECARQIEELKAALKLESLAVNEQWQRIALLRRILADDAEIRDRSEPWLAQLEKLVPLPGAPSAGSDPSGSRQE